ncbi:MAG: DUF4907 domain-containing protein [Flavobacteriales bacterium 32-34-25]|nr:MAG: DUF4907 domain-containing protein [Flavobacteriales bacterium 32-34-25]
MIINSNPKFFWINIQKNFISNTAKKTLFLSCLLLLFACSKKEQLNLESIKTPTGWGYVIKNNDKIIIKQSIIPVIPSQKSFKNEQEALKVGNLVLQKLKDKTSPTITKKDLILLSIKT